MVNDMFKCHECNKDVAKKHLEITVIEHQCKHEHHFCSFECLGNLAKP